MRDSIRRLMTTYEPRTFEVEGFPPAAVLILLYELAGEGLEVTVNELGNEMKAYRHGEHLIFGVTARVLGQFLDLVTAALVADAAPLNLPIEAQPAGS